MRRPRVRLTTARLLVAVMLVALGLAAAVRVGRVGPRREALRRYAAWDRREEATSRRLAALARSCPEGRRLDPPGRGTCPRCGPWWSATLNPEYAGTHERAARSLEEVADAFGRAAMRYERAAAAIWPRMPPESAPERAAVRDLDAGRGPLRVGYFRSF